MTRRDKDGPVPAPEEPVDPRTALQQAKTLARTFAEAEHVLRAYVEADTGLKAAELRARDLTERSEALERELPTLVARVTQAREMAAQADDLARNAYAQATTTVKAETAEAQMHLAKITQDGEARMRELEATYQARQAELTAQVREAETKLARIHEELAAVVARHSGPR